MNSNIINEGNTQQITQKEEINWLELCGRIWTFRGFVFRACIVGAFIGIGISFGTPKEYTANTLIVPEGYCRGNSFGMSVLVNIADIDISSSTATGRDAIYQSLYPSIADSTPFLIQLFDIKVREQKNRPFWANP